jgi:prepilin-type N-terminal cleavage/methylation domain-containing protein
MKKSLKKSGIRSGFSLAEVIVALTIGSMILVSILTVYNRIRLSANAVESKFESSGLKNEVLQRIAEDMDRIISSDTDTKVAIENKVTNGYHSAMIAFTKNYKDSEKRDRTFERITWTCGYDYQSQAGRLALYRSYTGVGLEDKVLDKKKYDWEREAYVPICSGITFMKISAIQDKGPVDKWDAVPPPGIIVTISFAEPIKKADGSYDVPEEEKFTRTIAIDRTKKINFDIEQAKPGSPSLAPAKTDASVANKDKANVK